MRSSVSSDSVLPHPPNQPNWSQEPPGHCSPAALAPARQALRYEVAGDSAVAGGPVRVRLVDVTRGRRLAADDEGRRVRDDPLAWLEGWWSPSATA